MVYFSSQNLSAEFKAKNTYAASMVGGGTYPIADNMVSGKLGAKTYNFVCELDGNQAAITISGEWTTTLCKVQAARV